MGSDAGDGGGGGAGGDNVLDMLYVLGSNALGSNGGLDSGELDKMGWRSNRIIWMSPTLLSSITTMPVIVSHNFSSFRFRYRLCYKCINSLRKCLC